MKAYKWVIVLAVLLFLSLIAGGVTALRANQQGYVDGHANGYSQGQHDGNKQGHQDGYTQGKLDGYNAGFSANSNSGYATGYSQGQTDELGAILDWQSNTCTMYSGGFYQMKFWRGYDGTIKYTCLVRQGY